MSKVGYMQLGDNNPRVVANPQADTITAKDVQGNLLMIRNVPVIMDCDLAEMFQVTRKEVLKTAIDNNDRLPEHFAFQLTPEETALVVQKCESLQELNEGDTLPIAFTEFGMMMMSFLLKGEAATNTSLQVLNSYIKLREGFVANRHSRNRMKELENRVNQKFQQMYLALDQMMKSEQKRDGKPKRRRIGFQIGDKKKKNGRRRIGFKLRPE